MQGRSFEVSVARVLISFPHAAARNAMRLQLDEDGHEVLAVETLAEAQMAFDSHVDVDVAVIAERLGDGNGVDFLVNQRSERPGCARVLIAEQMDLAGMVYAVNVAAPHQVVEWSSGAVAVRDAVESAILAARTQVSEARRPDPAHGRERLVRLLGGSDFRLAVQPIMTAQGTVFGFEGLMRSTDPVLASPGDILDFAQRHDMLPHVVYAVAQRAAAILPRIPATRRLFLNLHPEDLADPDDLVRLLAPVAPWSSRVALEINGRAHARWSSSLRARLAPLRRADYTVVVDDLGAGEGALMLLAEAAPTYIKAHDSIIRGVADSPHKRRILEMLGRFARGTSAQLIAEGVEREDEAAALRLLGVPFLQGYLFGRPQPSSEVFGPSSI